MIINYIIKSLFIVVWLYHTISIGYSMTLFLYRFLIDKYVAIFTMKVVKFYESIFIVDNVM